MALKVYSVNDVFKISSENEKKRVITEFDKWRNTENKTEIARKRSLKSKPSSSTLFL